jgi:hypothetical protein
MNDVSSSKMQDDGNANDDDDNDDGRAPPTRPSLATTMANLVLQVNRSHLDWAVDFLATRYPACGGRGSCDVVVCIVSTRRSTTSRSCSLLFLGVGFATGAGTDADSANDDENENNIMVSDFTEDMRRQCPSSWEG